MTTQQNDQQPEYNIQAGREMPEDINTAIAKSLRPISGLSAVALLAIQSAVIEDLTYGTLTAALIIALLILPLDLTAEIAQCWLRRVCVFIFKAAEAQSAFDPGGWRRAIFGPEVERLSEKVSNDLVKKWGMTRLSRDVGLAVESHPSV